jgi:cobalt/nickel transport system permease protein
MSSDWLSHHHGRRESLMHRLPAAPKLAVGMAILIGTVLLPSNWFAWHIGVSVLLLLAILVSRLSLFFLLKRLLLLSPFVFGVALVNALQPTVQANWRGLAVKSALCLMTVILISNTTPFGEVLRVLRRVRVPDLLITTIALMHRYLFVLADEAGRMRRARASRTFRRGRRFHWHTLATVAGQLFVRASERAERIYDAMCARGWK